MPPDKPLPPTLTETPALVRRGFFLVTMQKEGVRAVRLRPEKPLTIGRAPDCDVELDTPLLSRVHFSIASVPSVRIQDHNSSNGTKVNGVLLPPGVPTPLEIGSLIEAGGIFFVLKDRVPEHEAPASEAAIPRRGRRCRR